MAVIRSARYHLPLVVPVAGAIVLAAGGGLAAVETDTVEGFWHGTWWALSLMTTVGFVDSEPLTTIGRLISAVLMVTGFIRLALVTAAIASIFVREEERPEELAIRALEQRVLVEIQAVHDHLQQLERTLGADSDS